MRGSRPKVTQRSRSLRQSSTIAERKLWLLLRNRQAGGAKFVRQEPIGPYTVDFVCRDQRLVIEVDGGQHADSRSDRARDAYLRTQKYRVLRFWNNDVLGNTEGVYLTIMSVLSDAHLPTSNEGEA